jgi:hypothetical protein
MELLMQLVNPAAECGQSEVQVYRFPNSLCSDRGRKINNSEPGWDETLEGRPGQGCEFWRDHLKAGEGDPTPSAQIHSVMQLDVPSALSRRRPGSTFAVGTGFRRCSGT